MVDYFHSVIHFYNEINYYAVTSPFARRKGLSSASPAASPRAGRAVLTSRRQRNIEAVHNQNEEEELTKATSPVPCSGEVMTRLALMFPLNSRNSSPASSARTRLSGNSQDSAYGSKDIHRISSSNASPVSTLTGNSIGQYLIVVLYALFKCQ